MGAYNQFRGHPACANDELYGILRNEWGFDGYIVSDCWAVSDFTISRVCRSCRGCRDGTEGRYRPWSAGLITTT